MRVIDGSSVITAGDISFLETYRCIYSHLRMATDFKKILMVFDDERVGVLTGPASPRSSHGHPPMRWRIPSAGRL